MTTATTSNHGNGNETKHLMRKGMKMNATYRLTSAKGEFRGTLAECVEQQRESCGSFAEIAKMRGDSVLCEVSVDDDHIDWSEDNDGVVAQVEHALSISTE